MRETIHLNFDWYFRRDFQKDYLRDFVIFPVMKSGHSPPDIMLPYNYLPENQQVISTYKTIVHSGGMAGKTGFGFERRPCSRSYLNDKLSQQRRL